MPRCVTVRVLLMQDLRTEPRQRRSQQSIDAILDAAERLIHEQGQVSFTAAELAAAANMSIGRVYYWFPGLVIGRGVFLISAFFIVGAVNRAGVVVSAARVGRLMAARAMRRPSTGTRERLLTEPAREG